MATTLVNITDSVMRVLGDLTNKIWALAQIQTVVISGYKQLCSESGCFVKILDLNDVIGVATVDLSVSAPDFVELSRVCWNGYKIEPIDVSKVQFADPAFLTQRGDVQGFLFDGDGPRTIRKWRVPSASASNKFRLEYTRLGTTVAAAGDAFEVPDRFAKYLRFYALWKLLEQDGDGQDLKWAAFWHNKWRGGLAEMRMRKARARIARVGSFGEPSVGRRGKPPRPQLPWNYPLRRK